MWIIYKHTLIVAGERFGWSYIGQTKQEPNRRWKNGLGYAKKDKSSIFWNAIQKYGWDSFSHEILEYNIISLDEANKREKYWIAYYHTYIDDPQCRGYNMTTGGDVCEVSQEVSKKISEAKHGHIVSAETRAKISAANKGKPSKLRGKKFSVELKAKLSRAHSGVPLSKEHAAAIGKANLGREVSDETRIKLSNAQSGQLNHNSGKSLSEETKIKMSNAHKGQHPWNAGRLVPNKAHAVVQLTIDFIFIAEFESIIAAKNATHVSTISEVCRGVKLLGGGYRWLYKEDYIKWKEQNENNIVQG